VNKSLRCLGLVLLSLAGSSVAFPQTGTGGSPPTKKADPTSTNAGGGGQSSGSSLWITSRKSACEAKNGKKILLALQGPTTSSTQPFLVEISQGEVPTFYSGEVLTIEIDATEEQTKVIPLVKLGVDLQKANPINIAPVRPSFSQPQAGVKNPEYFCLSWPTKLIGDTIPQITVTAIYKPLKPTEADPEKTITLGVISYPQVHTLYHFNIATGVVVSSLRNPSFSRVQSAVASSGSPAQFKTVEQGGSIYAAPALFFTAYLIKPMDAESAWRRSDLLPEPSLGFSLSSPADNFFFGGSSEILRNVQLVYGYHMGKVTKLVPPLVNDPTSNAAPTTAQRFKSGAYGGLTFNIDFIKGLFTGK
jgi:hypothetical protein